MKKLFLGLAVAASSLTFAQTFGVKAGMNVASISKGDGLENNAKIGPYAGLTMNIPLAESFSVQPELLYNGLGAKSVRTSDVLGVHTVDTRTQNLSYISLPVMLQYNVTPSFYLEAGPEFGALVSAKYKGDTVVTSSGAEVHTSKDQENKDEFNGFNAGIGLGAGYFFTPNIGLTARYTAGLTKLGKDANNYYSDAKNNVFQVGLAYKFGK